MRTPIFCFKTAHKNLYYNRVSVYKLIYYPEFQMDHTAQIKKRTDLLHANTVNYGKSDIPISLVFCNKLNRIIPEFK